MKFPGRVGKWSSEQMIKFWWRFRSWIRIHIHVAILVRLVRHALVEVCSVPVLLV